jgi:ankyrin repeat protein
MGHDFIIVIFILNLTLAKHKKNIVFSYIENQSNDETNQEEHTITKTKEEVNEELINATVAANLDNVKNAIEKGADIDFIGDNLTTALQYGSKNGHLDIVEYLVESGANLEVADQSNFSMTALHYAAENNHLEIVKYLVSKKANIDSKQIHGMTALHLSAWKGFFEIAIYLIQNGADVQSSDLAGKTPLHMISYGIFIGK